MFEFIECVMPIGVQESKNRTNYSSGMLNNSSLKVSGKFTLSNLIIKEEMVPLLINDMVEIVMQNKENRKIQIIIENCEISKKLIKNIISNFTLAKVISDVFINFDCTLDGFLELHNCKQDIIVNIHLMFDGVNRNIYTNYETSNINLNIFSSNSQLLIVKFPIGHNCSLQCGLNERNFQKLDC